MKNIYIFLVLIYNLNAYSQDTIRCCNWKRAIFPVILTGSATILSNSTFEHKFRNKIREKTGNNFSCRIDDYFQYAPIIELYAFDVLGVKSRNHWFDQTKYLLISNILTTAIAQGIKRTILKNRPSGAPYSFPSGHTTFSFTNATVLYNEYKDSSPLVAYSGYVFSSATGIFRMLNDKHWLSDVLFGAGIGMGIANLVYYFEPFKSFNPFLKSKNISIIPQFGSETKGIYFSYLF